MRQGAFWSILSTILFLSFFLAGCARQESAGVSSSLPTEQAEVIVLAEAVRVGSRTLKTGDRLSAGATIATDAKGRAEIKLSDGSVLRLGENGKLTLASLDKKKPSFKLLAGNLFTRAREVADRDNFTVETATTVATVRGTSFGHLAGQFYKIIGLKNQVGVGFSNQTERMELKEGKQWTADPQKPLQDAPLTLTAAEKAWLRWNLEREAALGIRYSSSIEKLIQAPKTTTTPTSPGATSGTTDGANQPSSTSSAPSNASPSNNPSNQTPWGQGPSQ